MTYLVTRWLGIVTDRQLTTLFYIPCLLSSVLLVSQTKQRVSIISQLIRYGTSWLRLVCVSPTIFLIIIHRFWRLDVANSKMGGWNNPGHIDNVMPERKEEVETMQFYSNHTWIQFCIE